MSNQCIESIFLSWRDWKFEFLLSLCSVLALASMLTPILILQGLKNGIIQGMRDQLLKDPTVLIITPKSDAGKYTPEFIEKLAKMPGALFAIGRTRATATDITLYNPAANVRQSIAFEPAADGEPVLEKYDIKTPQNGKEPELVLSAASAKALHVDKGSILKARLGRKSPEGKLESTELTLHVLDILPIQAADRKMAFAPLKLLEDIENYRDYLEVPERGFAGRPNSGQRAYASFRLYAAGLDDVKTLADELEKENIEVITKAREITAIRSLENAINQVILIISLAVGAGFLAFTLSSVQSAISRKKKMLGMLRLLGFKRFPLMLYPLTQSMLTAIFGFSLSLLIYWGVGFIIEQAFASQGTIICKLAASNLSITFAAVLVLSILASAKASFTAASIEPSIVIREV